MLNFNYSIKELLLLSSICLHEVCINPFLYPTGLWRRRLLGSHFFALILGKHVYIVYVFNFLVAFLLKNYHEGGLYLQN